VRCIDVGLASNNRFLFWYLYELVWPVHCV
jgi:hypothetical protein